MKKIKFKNNDKVMTFDFCANIFNNDFLYELCKIFDLKEIYIDIYSINIRKTNFYEILMKNDNDIMINVSDSTNLQNINIKTNIDIVSTITNLLYKFDFEDLNIWNCYTDWEQYLIDKKPAKFIIKKINNFEKLPKFYLNYKEGKIEIISKPTVNAEEIYQKIKELIKNKSK